MISSADILGDYRYTLSRTWDESREPLVFIMLNPSTADASQDDPTIRRCIHFAQRENFGGILVVNLYAFRATDPRVMFAAADPVGPANDRVIQEMTRGRTVVAAWGAHAKQGRVDQVLALIQPTARVRALGTTKNGSPRHPLYVRGDAPFIVWPTENISPPEGKR